MSKRCSTQHSSEKQKGKAMSNLPLIFLLSPLLTSDCKPLELAGIIKANDSEAILKDKNINSHLAKLSIFEHQFKGQAKFFSPVQFVLKHQNNLIVQDVFKHILIDSLCEIMLKRSQGVFLFNTFDQGYATCSYCLDSIDLIANEKVAVFVEENALGLFIQHQNLKNHNW